MRLGSPRWLAALVCSTLLPGANARAANVPAGRMLADADGEIAITLLVDRDDDDDDGVPDFEGAVTRDAALGDVVWIEPKGGPRKLDSVEGSSVRLIVAGKALRPEAAVGKRLGRFGVQGVRAGGARIRLAGLDVKVDVLDLLALDATGEAVDFARSHAALSRALPVASKEAPLDLEALSFVVAGAVDKLPRWVSIASFRPDLSSLDTLGEVALEPRPCPPGTESTLVCRGTAPIRSAGDIMDRSHPEAARHSLLAEVGGRLVISVDRAMAGLRVGGPRHSALGALSRFRGKLRVRLVRMSAGGSPPVGGDDAGALAVAQGELRTANALWGQCGIVFGAERELDVSVVDPPGPYLLSLGCDLGTPASGGEIALRVDEREVRVQTKPGQSPTQVAAVVAQALRRAGFRPVVSPNALVSPGALRSVDVLVRRTDGKDAKISTVGERASTDPALGVCIGSVDLSNGLSHFSDFDAAAGTLEERTLLKAFDDGDPSSVEVLVVPAFGRAGRIGESFIYGDGASLRNAVIVDRAGVRAGARSFALAHELGHILLDLPGHPDDYGVDRPSLLMDADATDPSVFGPRRLTLADCERALSQSGPKAPVPLLESWELTRPATERRPSATKK